MEKLRDLKDLLTHEIHDLLSAEDQILEALPTMIEKASNPELKKALKEHMRITEMQRKRLDQVNSLLSEPVENETESGNGVSSFLAKLFGNGVHKCKGMEGLISEGNKIMALDMNPEVLDSAIIACAQKIEHYEICAYGTARAFARELSLENVAILLQETLDEEYAADAILTRIAVGGLNEKAENASDGEMGQNGEPVEKTERSKKTTGARSFYGGGHGGAKKAAANDSTGKARGPKKSSSPNRRQVAPKGTTDGNINGVKPRRAAGEGKPQSAANKRTGGPGKKSGGRAQTPAKGRSHSASKGRSSGGGRGGNKSGGGRGHS